MLQSSISRYLLFLIAGLAWNIIKAVRGWYRTCALEPFGPGSGQWAFVAPTDTTIRRGMILSYHRIRSHFTPFHTGCTVVSKCSAMRLGRAATWRIKPSYSCTSSDENDTESYRCNSRDSNRAQRSDVHLWNLRHILPSSSHSAQSAAHDSNSTGPAPYQGFQLLLFPSLVPAQPPRCKTSKSSSNLIRASLHAKDCSTHNVVFGRLNC